MSSISHLLLTPAKYSHSITVTYSDVSAMQFKRLNRMLPKVSGCMSRCNVGFGVGGGAQNCRPIRWVCKIVHCMGRRICRIMAQFHPYICVLPSLRKWPPLFCLKSEMFCEMLISCKLLLRLSVLHVYYCRLNWHAAISIALQLAGFTTLGNRHCRQDQLQVMVKHIQWLHIHQRNTNWPRTASTPIIVTIYFILALRKTYM